MHIDIQPIRTLRTPKRKVQPCPQLAKPPQTFTDWQANLLEAVMPPYDQDVVPPPPPTNKLAVSPKPVPYDGSCKAGSPLT